MASHRELEIGLGGGIYTMEMSKSCRPGLPFPSPSQLLTVTSTVVVVGGVPVICDLAGPPNDSVHAEV